MSTLTIDHTDAEGTLLHGSTRGDGTAQVVKALGWRWGRSIGAWYVPRSRDAAPNRTLIEQTARALEAAGFAVAVTVDGTVGDQAEAELRRAERARGRAQRLQARAERHGAAATERWEAGRRIADRIPFGQPILVGHHSQARAERDAARIGRHLRASAELQEQADRVAAAAAAAAASTGARHNPVTVANRIERLAAQARSDERELAKLPAGAAGETTRGHTLLREQLARTTAELEHWRSVRAEQLAAGIATNYSRDSVQRGDLVQIRGQWRKVVRTNTKTVAVETGYSWTDKTPWHEVRDHRSAAVAKE